MSLTKIQKTEDFDKFVADHQNYLVIVFFSADWSDECKLMSSVVDEILKNEELKKTTKFLELEAEEHEEISIKFNIEAVPTFVFLRNKQVIQKVIGANAPELRKKIELASQVGETLSNIITKPDINTRLAGLVKKSPMVVFMKGSPQEPRCGFSRQIIEILKTQNCQFSYFDILSENEVREGLKKYSDWPTFPQLYIDGEFVGGLDIIKEMVKSGEFKSMIPQEKTEETLNDRLKKLINRSKVMLFMKGNRDHPQCGFSRQMIQIMNEAKQQYGTFDILSDEEVRAGIKTYSNWPTFPQLYVDGEFVGGLDIVKELVQEGEFESTLKGNAA